MGWFIMTIILVVIVVAFWIWSEIAPSRREVRRRARGKAGRRRARKDEETERAEVKEEHKRTKILESARRAMKRERTKMEGAGKRRGRGKEKEAGVDTQTGETVPSKPSILDSVYDLARKRGKEIRSAVEGSLDEPSADEKSLSGIIDDAIETRKGEEASALGKITKLRDRTKELHLSLKEEYEHGIISEKTYKELLQIMGQSEGYEETIKRVPTTDQQTAESVRYDGSEIEEITSFEIAPPTSSEPESYATRGGRAAVQADQSHVAALEEYEVMAYKDMEADEGKSAAEDTSGHFESLEPNVPLEPERHTGRIAGESGGSDTFVFEGHDIGIKARSREPESAEQIGIGADAESAEQISQHESESGGAAGKSERAPKPEVQVDISSGEVKVGLAEQETESESSGEHYEDVVPAPAEQEPEAEETAPEKEKHLPSSEPEPLTPAEPEPSVSEEMAPVAEHEPQESEEQPVGQVEPFVPEEPSEPEKPIFEPEAGEEKPLPSLEPEPLTPAEPEPSVSEEMADKQSAEELEAIIEKTHKVLRVLEKQHEKGAISDETYRELLELNEEKIKNATEKLEKL